MSWFGDQVKQRKQFDEKNFESAFWMLQVLSLEINYLKN